MAIQFRNCLGFASVLVGLGLCLSSCERKGKSTGSLAEPEEAVATAPSYEERLTSEAKKGNYQFTITCAGCHGVDGGGSGPYPPLDGSPYVGGDPHRLLLMVAKGVFGPIEVHGKRYGQESMPGWERERSAEELARILTYLRSSWSNGESIPLEEQLVEIDQVSEWLRGAKEVSGPIHFKRFDSGEWLEMVEAP